MNQTTLNIELTHNYINKAKHKFIVIINYFIEQILKSEHPTNYHKPFLHNIVDTTDKFVNSVFTKWSSLHLLNRVEFGSISVGWQGQDHPRKLGTRGT